MAMIVKIRTFNGQTQLQKCLISDSNSTLITHVPKLNLKRCLISHKRRGNKTATTEIQ